MSLLLKLLESMSMILRRPGTLFFRAPPPHSSNGLANAVSIASILFSSPRQECLRGRMTQRQRVDASQKLVVRAMAKNIAFDQSSG